MLSWFKKFTKRSRQESAYDLGAECANDFVASLRLFVETRFQPVHQQFLEILAKNFRDNMHRTDAPPLTLARIDYDVFLENVEDIRTKMHTEITERMRDWIELSNDLGVRANMGQAIEAEIDNFCANLTLHGVKLFADYVIPLKHADDAWRKSNASLAANFPEVGDLPV